MKTWDLELNISRLLTGQKYINIDGNDILICNNSVFNNNKINLIIKKRFDQTKYDFLNKNQLEFIFQRRGILEPQYKTKIKNMNDKLEDLKLKLFLTGPRVEQAKKIRKTILSLRSSINSYSNYISGLFDVSFESMIEYIKILYQLIETAKFVDGRNVFNISSIDYSLLKRVSEEIKKSSLSIEDLRYIARSSEWRSFWCLGQSNCFKQNISDLDDEQRLICSFSKMYDNALNHTEFPINIIDDDDKFDGWMIHQRNMQEDQKKEQNVNSGKKFDHVFMAASTQEEANNIYDLNSSSAKNIMGARAKQLKTEQKVKVFNDLLGKKNNA